MGTTSVLVVDDDAATREAFTGILELGGYDVVGAADGREALQRAAQNRPDVLVIDLSLPELDGDVFVREWREISHTDPAVVVVSSRPNGCEETKDLHAQACLRKPIDAEELLAVVDTATLATSG